MRAHPPAPVAGDLAGQVCVVTGASSGIGREAARELARLGAHVVLAVRNAGRGEEVRAAIAAEHPRATLEVALVDLGSQESACAFTDAVLARHPRIDVLVNNAGTWSSKRRVSPDGIELTWATNVLAYHLVLARLLAALRAAPHPRVVNVASRLAHGLDLADVQFEQRRYGGVDAYAQSKQADRMLTWAWARRAPDIRLNAIHPGAVNTGLFAKGGGIVGMASALYATFFGLTVAQGADTIVWLAASPEAADLTGEFVVNRRPRTCAFRDAAAEDALFDLCERMTGEPAAGVLA